MKNIVFAATLLSLTAGFAFASGAEEKKADPAMSAPATTVEAGAYDVSMYGPRVIPFTSKQNVMSMAASKKVVLLFLATWCPTCQATYKDIQMNYGNIPADTVFVFVNYDKETALKAEFGITSQHTFVSLTPAGVKKNLWVGTMTVTDILAKI